MENKQLTPLLAFAKIKKDNYVSYIEEQNCYECVENALKEYQELSKIEYRQNTINDFYPSTKEMIDDLLNLVTTKVYDNLEEGKRYSKAGVLETLGFAIRYVKTFAYGGEFNNNEKIGVREKKLQALEIIKSWLSDRIIRFDEDLIVIRLTENYICNPNDTFYYYIVPEAEKEQIKLLKEVLL